MPFSIDDIYDALKQAGPSGDGKFYALTAGNRIATFLDTPQLWGHDPAVTDYIAQPLVLGLKLFEPLHLVCLQAAELLVPPIIGHFREADRAHRLRHRPALHRQNINLPQLGYKSLRAWVSSRSSVLLQASKAILQGGPSQWGRIMA